MRTPFFSDTFLSSKKDIDVGRGASNKNDGMARDDGAISRGSGDLHGR